MYNTPIHKLSENLNNNAFYMKREDLLPFSFGGNKARKAEKFKEDILNKKADTVVTYGSSESNHCRIIANMCASLNITCHIISPEEEYINTNNSRLIEFFGAKVTKAPLKAISDTIDKIIEEYKRNGKKVYFIPGGGHGNLGTEAYIDAYREIVDYEDKKNIYFDYIFFASGTGTTQAGLICGQINNNDSKRKIVGISIARNKEKGENIIHESIKSYIQDDNDYSKYIIFDDSYTNSGYNKYGTDTIKAIKKVLKEDGIALNTTYTGKAYNGMLDYIKKNNIAGKNILFINTGGTPLFFDNIEEIIK